MPANDFIIEDAILLSTFNCQIFRCEGTCFKKYSLFVFVLYFFLIIKTASEFSKQKSELQFFDRNTLYGHLSESNRELEKFAP